MTNLTVYKSIIPQQSFTHWPNSLTLIVFLARTCLPYLSATLNTFSTQHLKHLAFHHPGTILAQTVSADCLCCTTKVQPKCHLSLKNILDLPDLIATVSPWFSVTLKPITLIDILHWSRIVDIFSIWLSCDSVCSYSNINSEEGRICPFPVLTRVRTLRVC